MLVITTASGSTYTLTNTGVLLTERTSERGDTLPPVVEGVVLGGEVYRFGRRCMRFDLPDGSCLYTSPVVSVAACDDPEPLVLDGVRIFQ